MAEVQRIVLGLNPKEPDKGRESKSSGSDPAEATSVISSDMRIIGDCSTSGRLRIHGKVYGDVAARGLELTSTGAIEGDVSASDGGAANSAFIIDGAVKGTVHAARVEVRRGGDVTGGVVADEAVVRGRVQGGIVARNRLVLEETAVVEGDVRARRLALSEGGEVNGTILMGERAAAGISGVVALDEGAVPAPAIRITS